MPVNEVYEPKRPLTSAELKAMELKLGIEFPQPYRRWLLKYNGGQPSPGRFRYKHESGPYTDGSVAWFYAIYEGKASNLWNTFQIYKSPPPRMPGELVPIATDPFGNEIVISVSGQNQGKVYFWDHEEETIPPSYKNCHLIADSFDEFINGLH
jgi:cell wall assembly regulator SMI1